MRLWWRLKETCEVPGCRALRYMQVQTSVDGANVRRWLCRPHERVWRTASSSDCDRMMREWGWPGEAWWRD